VGEYTVVSGNEDTAGVSRFVSIVAGGVKFIGGDSAKGNES